MSVPGPITRHSTTRCLPAATKAAMAEASAQRPCGKAAFSTLQPPWMPPSSSRTAAPTANFEYGAYACSIMVRARCSRSSISMLLLIRHADRLGGHGAANEPGQQEHREKIRQGLD